MLFPVKALYDSRRRLLKELDAGRISSAVANKRLRDLDPEDHFALLLTASDLKKQGDYVAAEQYLWQAVDLQPGFGPGYFELASNIIARGDKPLGGALLELSMRKELLDEAAFDSSDPDSLFADLAVVPGKEHLSTRERVQLATEGFLRDRDLEPVEVTTRMHIYRLIHRVQEDEDLDRDTVDAILKEGARAVPLLVGLLRGWAREVTPGEGVEMVENALAMLGEIGGVHVLPHLLEFVDLDDWALSATAVWAIRRIAVLFPEEALRVLVALSPDLSAGQRISVFNALARDKELDPGHQLLQALCRRTEKFSKKDCEFFVPLAIAAIMTIQGRDGANLATSLLRERGRLLTRDARFECESIIVDFGNEPVSPSTHEEDQPDSWTVYDICSGNAIWDEDGEDDDDESDSGEDFEEEDLNEDDAAGLEAKEHAALTPVTRANSLGRNDKCWCGSGKKYKKCHLEADQSAASTSNIKSVFEDLQERLLEAMPQILPKSVAEIGAHEFLGSTMGTEMESTALVDWMLHDWASPKVGHSVIEEFVRRQGARLTAGESEVLANWSQSHMDLYEVQEVQPGSSLKLKRLTGGEVMVVHDVALSGRVSLWDGLLARVIQGARGLEVTGVAESVPRAYLTGLLDWLRKEQSLSGESGAGFWKSRWPRIRRHAASLHTDWLENLALANSDGEPLLLGKSVFEVHDLSAVDAALRARAEFQLDQEGDRFVWLDGDVDRESRTVLGTIRFHGDTLSLETNSKHRSDRGKALLADVAGPAIRHLRDEFTTQKEVKRRVAEAAPASDGKGQRVLPTADQNLLVNEILTSHYSTWADRPLPALGGRTPRQAVTSKGGKRAVVEILKDIENGEEKKKAAGGAFYDVNLLRVELGISKPS